MPKPEMLNLRCEVFFTRSRMFSLGISERMQTKVVHLFDGVGPRVPPGFNGIVCVAPYNGVSVRDFVGEHKYRRTEIRKLWFCGEKLIEAINQVLRSENLPEI